MNELLEEEADEKEAELKQEEENARKVREYILSVEKEACRDWMERELYDESYLNEIEEEYRDPDYYDRFISLPDEKMQIDS